MRFHAVLAAPFVVLLAAQAPRSTAGEPIATTNDCACLRSAVSFDVTSVEKLYVDPEGVLADIDRFWSEDPAYALVAKWHDRNQQPRNLKDWVGRIEAIRSLSPVERKSHPHLAAAKSLSAVEDSFVAAAVPYLCTFLPPEADLSSTLYFADEIMPSGIQIDGDIVVHIVNCELTNMFVHEVFHRGFASLYEQHDLRPADGDLVSRMLVAFQNEGMATYVGYECQGEFPRYWGDDYRLLDDPAELRRLHGEMNQLFREARELSDEELRTRSWEVGVRRRGHYVVGAYAAKTIDETLGRDALRATITLGPRAFVAIYNAVAPGDMKLDEL